MPLNLMLIAHNTKRNKSLRPKFFARSGMLFCLKRMFFCLEESGRQKTKEIIVPRGKFRPVENSLEY